MRSYVENKIDSLRLELSKITGVAKTQPQSAYAALTHGLAAKWLFISRTTPTVADLFAPLEQTIQEQLIPKMTVRDTLNLQEREILALPTRLGGLSLNIPTLTSDLEYKISRLISFPLTERIIAQEESYTEIRNEIRNSQLEMHKTKRLAARIAALELKSRLNEEERMLELASEKGASNWPTTIPLERYNFDLHKGAFRDALNLRYGWEHKHLPSHCGCNKPFSVDHALSCPIGGYPIIRHNELRELTADLFRKAGCRDVVTEDVLQDLEGERMAYNTANTQDGARLDVRAAGFWGGQFERAFFDVRVFNPYAPKNRTTQMRKAYASHEKEKNRQYHQRII